MKKFKKLIPAMVMLLIATMLMGTTTYAWFSMNKTVTATGMMVTAQAEGSIVITNTSSLPTASVKTTNIDFTSVGNTNVYASTHAAIDATYTDGLKYVNNAEKINLETGLAKNATEKAAIAYSNAANVPSGKQYYKDFSVYIAGDGQAFEHQDITITLEGSSTGSNNINNAVSIDFYGLANASAAATATAANYKGTLNVAGVKNKADMTDHDAYTSFVIEDVTIPQTGTSSAYSVLMRVYYDGELIDTAGTNEGYTSYKAATGTAIANHYYYTDNLGTSVATVATGASVVGLYEVDTDASPKAYARTVDVADLEQVTLKVTFVASAHP